MRLVLGVVLLVLVALLTWMACTPACSSSNCQGCCQPSGFCAPGTDDTACGRFGAACQACSNSQSCSSHACSASDAGVTTDGGGVTDAGSQVDSGTCDPSSCTGCCAGVVCLPFAQQSVSNCGTGGQACQTCNSASQTCQGGSCVSGCGPSNCGGCCAGSTCIALASQGGAQTTSQCGYGGEVCRACPGGEQCSPDGLCVLPVDGGVDAGPTWDFPCGNYPPCSLSQQCCTTITSSGVSFSCVVACSSQQDVIACDGPEECAANQVCCGIENVNGGTSPNCSPTSLGATCLSASNCPTQFANNCQGTNQIVICHTSADCAADPSNNNCCAFTQNGATLTFCASGTLALFADQCF